jgi:hypothetical protein
VAFLVLALEFSRGAVSMVQAAAGVVPAVTKDVSVHDPHLPEVDLPCSIRVAYQAADAGHPDMGLSKLAAEQANSVRQ